LLIASTEWVWARQSSGMVFIIAHARYSWIARLGGLRRTEASRWMNPSQSEAQAFFSGRCAVRDRARRAASRKLCNSGNISKGGGRSCSDWFSSRHKSRLSLSSVTEAERPSFPLSAADALLAASASTSSRSATTRYSVAFRLDHWDQTKSRRASSTFSPAMVRQIYFDFSYNLLFFAGSKFRKRRFLSISNDEGQEVFWSGHERRAPRKKPRSGSGRGPSLVLR
jgi:hypothetical protein